MESLLDYVYKYANQHKAPLINQGNFSLIIQLGHFMTISTILTLQKTKYYRSIVNSEF